MASAHQQSMGQQSLIMAGMADQHVLANQKYNQQAEINMGVHQMLGEIRGAFHGLQNLRGQEIQQHYHDGRTVNIDGRAVNVDGRTVNVDGRTVNVDGRTVNVDARTAYVHHSQQNNTLYHMAQQNYKAQLDLDRRTGTKRGSGEEVPATDAKRPPRGPPGAGAVRMIADAPRVPEMFSISSGPSSGPAPSGPPPTQSMLATNQYPTWMQPSSSSGPVVLPTASNAAQSALETMQYGQLATLAKIGGALGARSAREAKQGGANRSKAPTQGQVVAEQAAQLAAYGKKRNGGGKQQKPY